MNIGCTFLIPPGHLLTTSTKTASATPVLAAPASPMLSWSKSLQPGHRGQSSCTDVVLLPLVLSGSSEDSAKSEDHDATSQKRNAKENQYVDTKEPMKAFHAFFSCHALNLRDLGRNTFGCLWFLHHFQCEISTKDFSHGAKKIWPQRSWLTVKVLRRRVFQVFDSEDLVVPASPV